MKKSLDQRLNLAFYQNRVATNLVAKRFLIDKIFEYCPDFPLDREEMSIASIYEDLLEIAIATVNKNLTIVLGQGQDFCDGSDAKFACVRTSSRGKMYSAPVTGTINKTGSLRVLCYERKLQKFYYFIVPLETYKNIPKTSNIEIPFELDGTPKRKNRCKVNWWNYEVASFEDMCRGKNNEHQN